MIIQKVNKKKLYINIAALVVVFAITIYLLLPSLSSFGAKKTEKLIGGEQGLDVKIIKKYSSLKRINLELFDDERYLNLREPRRNNYPELEKGNPNPFGVSE